MPAPTNALADRIAAATVAASGKPPLKPQKLPSMAEIPVKPPDSPKPLGSPWVRPPADPHRDAWTAQPFRAECRRTAA
jgi:hypothetical protein